jgi:hypothetical protein
MSAAAYLAAAAISAPRDYDGRSQAKNLALAA